MSILQILNILGAPALFVALLKYMQKSVKKVLKDMELVKEGTQALLRTQMISEYNKWTKREHAPLYARENFENCWKKYHQLGANGVMDDLHERFMALPTEEGEKQND